MPEVCTLPTVEQPLRQAEFDSLFATALRAQARSGRALLRWSLDPDMAATVRDLAARETVCCSFFTFTEVEGLLQVDVSVPAAHVDVLDALAARADAGMGSR
ncbi:MAG TPA: hypothetical protein VIT65_08590 [Microlunatus sp.]